MVRGIALAMKQYSPWVPPYIFFHNALRLEVISWYLYNGTISFNFRHNIWSMILCVVSGPPQINMDSFLSSNEFAKHKYWDPDLVCQRHSGGQKRFSHTSNASHLTPNVMPLCVLCRSALYERKVLLSTPLKRKLAYLSMLRIISQSVVRASQK